jgi:adenine deaminase
METAVGLKLSEFEKVLGREDVLGIGEAYWTRVVGGDERMLAQAGMALSRRKTLEGHAAGAKGQRLVHYLITGITSDHESTTVDEALEKLRFGVYVMIREGFVRRELGELSKLKDLDVDKRRLILVSDVFDAVMLCEEGYLDSVVRRAIELGFSPIEAIKMATINAADYYGLRHLGAIAPLRHADILFLDDLESVSISHVMVNGEMVVTDREFRGQIRPYTYPDAMKQTIKAEKVTEADFRIPAVPGKKRVRVIHLVNETITRETEGILPVAEGYLQKDLDRDILPVAVIYRGGGRRMGKGFITGTGIKEGAFATNLTWDTGNILVVGSSEAEMANAVNRLIDLQGGYVISRKGKISYEFAMPVFGLIPECSLRENAEKTKELDVRMAEIGSTMARPFLALQTIPFTGLPFLRITDKGLADIKNKRLVSLYLD